MIESIIDKDIELLIFLNNLGTTQWDGFWLILTNKFSAIPLYILLLYFAFKNYGLKRTLVLLLFCSIINNSLPIKQVICLNMALND